MRGLSRIMTNLRVLRRLKGSQIAGRVRLKWRHWQVRGRGLERVLPRRRLALAPEWSERLSRWRGIGSDDDSGHVERSRSGDSSFYNLPGERFIGNAAWLKSGAGRAGRYQRELPRIELFFHEFIGSEGSSPEEQSQFLADYIRGYSDRADDNALEWHPYAVGCRTVQWLKWIGDHSREIPASLQMELLQAALLGADYVEWMQEVDIEANHWLKNLWSIVVIDMLLNPDAEAVRRSLEDYLGQLEIQLLPDGAHYERCPMYHAKILADASLLDRMLPTADPLRGRWRAGVDRMRDWLEHMRLSENKWVNFNDSWQIQKVSAAVWPVAVGEPKTGLWHLKSSGFVRGNGSGGWRWVLDCGGVGPSFNPGHSHSDLLSLVLHHGESPVVVDPGTLHYSPNDERAFLKSCHAHNGPCLADRDHTEMVGSFRIGRAGQCGETVVESTSSGHVAESHHSSYPGVNIRRRVEDDGVAVRVLDVWEPVLGKSYRPWLRWLFAVSLDDLQNVEVGSSQVSFRIPAKEGRGAFEIAMKADGIDLVRFKVGESFHSQRFGREEAGTELLATADKCRQRCSIETRIEWRPAS